MTWRIGDDGLVHECNRAKQTLLARTVERLCGPRPARPLWAEDHPGRRLPTMPGERAPKGNGRSKSHSHRRKPR